MKGAGERGQLRGILHASGILHDALIGQQTPALVREVYAPKVAGGQALMRVGALCMPCKHLCPGTHSDYLVLASCL